MHYKELPWPFDGWTVDERGVLYSPNGYRTTPEKIEGMCWLHNVAVEEYGKRIIFADTPLVEPRRQMLEQRDIDWPRPNDIKVSVTGYRRSKSRLVPRTFPACKSKRRSPG